MFRRGSKFSAFVNPLIGRQVLSIDGREALSLDDNSKRMLFGDCCFLEVTF